MGVPRHGIPKGKIEPQRPVKISSIDDSHALSTEASSNVNNPAGALDTKSLQGAVRASVMDDSDQIILHLFQPQAG